MINYDDFQYLLGQFVPKTHKDWLESKITEKDAINALMKAVINHCVKAKAERARIEPIIAAAHKVRCEIDSLALTNQELYEAILKDGVDRIKEKD